MKYSREDFLKAKEKVINYLEQNKQKSYTTQELCKELDIEDETLVTIILGALELKKKVMETDFDKIFESDGSPVLLPKFRYVENPEKVFNKLL